MCVGDVKVSVVGVLSLVLQSYIHHHPPPVSFDHPQRSLGPLLTYMAAKSTTRLYRLHTELTGREGWREEEEEEDEARIQYSLFKCA